MFLTVVEGLEDGRLKQTVLVSRSPEAAAALMDQKRATMSANSSRILYVNQYLVESPIATLINEGWYHKHELPSP